MDVCSQSCIGRAASIANAVAISRMQVVQHVLDSGTQCTLIFDSVWHGGLLFGYFPACLDFILQVHSF